MFFLVLKPQCTAKWHVFYIRNRHISVGSFVYKYDKWPHDSYMTGRAGVWEADDILYKTSFFFHWHLFFYFISSNNCWLLTIKVVSFIFFYYRESKPPFCLHYEKSSPVNIVYRKINWQKPRLHKRLYPIRV